MSKKKKELIHSSIGNQFHPMLASLAGIVAIIFVCFENYNATIIPISLALFLALKDKVVHVNLKHRTVKEGWFSSRKKLSENGYLSIFKETESQIIRSRVNEAQTVMSNIYVNYIVERDKTHIYKAKDIEEAIRIAKRMNQHWNCGIYNGLKKEWIVPNN